MEQPEFVATLKAQHAELEEALEDESRRPMPNPETISDLKKRKLRIKDQIASLESA